MDDDSRLIEIVFSKNEYERVESKARASGQTVEYLAKAVILRASVQREKTKETAISARPDSSATESTQSEDGWFPPGITLFDLMRNWENESDRGVVLVCQSVLDRGLTELLIRQCLATHTPDDHISALLTREQTPFLQSCAMKARIIRAFALLRPSICEAVLALNRIRIDAAHDPAKFEIVEGMVAPILKKLEKDDATVVIGRASGWFIAYRAVPPKGGIPSHQRNYSRVLLQVIFSFLTDEIGGAISRLSATTTTSRTEFQDPGKHGEARHT
jgi:hypothetical protein